MKTNKSSAECAAHNERNKVEIELGLIEAIEPSEQILAAEAKAREQEKAGLKIAQDTLTVFRMLDPNFKEGQREIQGVEVSIEMTYTGGSSYSRGYHTGWKMFIGGRYDDNKKWMVIGDGKELGLNTKQLAKAKDHLETVKSVTLARETRNKENNAAYLRREAWLKIEENQKLAQVILNTTYVSTSDKIAVNADGTITVQYDTFTFAQWELVAVLKLEQRAAMDALKATFKTVKA